MWPALDRSTLQGVQLAVPDRDAAVAFAEQVLRLERTAPGATRFRIGAHWLAFEQRQPAGLPGNAATLLWRCRDLQRQQALLAQRGVDLQNDAEPGEATLLRVAAADTGACALQWTAEAQGKADVPPAAQGITALVLHARAPERVAAHWAQLFQGSVERPADGCPRLVLDGISLQFMFVEEATGGVSRMTLALGDAIANDANVDTGALAIAGLTIGLAQTASRG